MPGRRSDRADHIYAEGAATMRVKIAGILQVVEAKGPDMTQAETVTLLNDMCLLAPATLISDAIRWEVVGARAVRAAFTHAGHRIGAVVLFNDDGELIDFRSDDRLRSSADGKSFTRTPWSTPISGGHDFGAVRIVARGEARWHAPEGEFTYARIVIEDVKYNLRSLSANEDAILANPRAAPAGPAAQELALGQDVNRFT